VETRVRGRYAKKIEELEEHYRPSLFSDKSFKFKPTKEDWEIVKEYVSTIFIYLTNDCNLNCKICYRNSSTYDFEKDLTSDQISELLDKVGNNKRVVLMGGEPTVRKDLFEIIKKVRRSGNVPELYTNGLKLSGISYVQRLKDAGIERVNFSFDGFKKEIYERMGGGGRELNFKLTALQNLNYLDIDTVISSTIAKGINENQIKPLLDFSINSVRRNGIIRGIYFYGATKYGRYMIDDDTEILTPELAKILEEASNNQIDFEYMIETKKLMLNLAEYLNNFGIAPNFGSRGIMGLYRPGSIKEYISLPRLKQLNGKFENSKLSFFLESLKDGKIRESVFRFITKGRPLINAFPDGLFIGVGNVGSPRSHNAKMNDSIGIENSSSGGYIINCSGFCADEYY